MTLDRYFQREGLMPLPISQFQASAGWRPGGGRVRASERATAAQGAVSLGYVGGDTWDGAVQ